MNKYEIMFVVRPDMEEAEIRKTAEDMKKVLTDNKAKIVEEKEMGQRDLAYEIKKHNTEPLIFCIMGTESTYFSVYK